MNLRKENRDSQTLTTDQQDLSQTDVELDDAELESIVGGFGSFVGFGYGVFGFVGFGYGAFGYGGGYGGGCGCGYGYGY